MSSNLRPTINVLNDFAKKYFSKNPPKIKWKKMVDWGLSIADDNQILLNPNIPIDAIGCSIADQFYYKPNIELKLNDGEQYFKVLLHEIGHFKLKVKTPKEFYRVWNEGVSKLKELIKAEMDFGLREKKSYKNTLELVKENSKALDSFLIIKKRPGESYEDFEGRQFEFESWRSGDYIREHIEVEDWAIREFKRERTRIRKLLYT